MLNKTLSSIIVSLLCLSACAQNGSLSTTTPQYHAQSLLGKWHCKVQFDENSDYHYDTVYQADGTNHDKGVLTFRFNPTVKELVWQFNIETQNKWRMDNTHFFEQQIAKPQVKILPVQDQKSRILLTLFEKSNPDILEMKNNLLAGLSEWEHEEFKAKILVLNQHVFQSEMKFNDDKVMRICQRQS